MRTTITIRPAVFILAVLVVLGGWVGTKAQYIVSARAGLVNHTHGEVLWHTSSDTLSRRLAPYHHLNDGDAVLTRNGRAEILLNPGSVLRLDRDTEITFFRTDLPFVEFGITAGTVLLEAADLNRETVLRGRTPHALFRITKNGLYRIDVRTDATRFLVRSGELELVTEGRTQKVKKNQRAMVTAAQVEVVKLPNREPLDDFELWAKDRAEVLVAANRLLTRRREFGYGLMASAWVFDPLLGVYTFVPFGFDFISPWGRRFVYRCPYPTAWSWGPYVGEPGHGRSPGTSPPPATPSERSRPSFRVGAGRWEHDGVLTPGPAIGGRGEGPISHRPMPAPPAPVGGEIRSPSGPVKAPHHQ
jgi:hypothetical protein